MQKSIDLEDKVFKSRSYLERLLIATDRNRIPVTISAIYWVGENYVMFEMITTTLFMDWREKYARF